ncbi:glycosyltransferase family 2 protein [Metallosphaera sp.]|uniref:glycosyltransferase family 2 protein n=2 Tax=Sulfolobaceae TaxID=118883 RepID=UPI00315FC485
MNQLDAFYLIFGSLTLFLSLVYFILNSYFSINVRMPRRVDSNKLSDVTVLIPVYGEKASVFERVISAVAEQDVKFLVVGDGCDEPYRSITFRYGGRFIKTPARSGKRNALATGISHVDTKFVLFLDSDTVLPSDGVRRMLSLMDEGVGGVSVNVRNVKTGNTFYLAELIERLKEATMRAVNRSGYAVLLNGKCSLYRTELVRPFILSEEFRNPRFMGRRALIGDDKQLTNYVISRGYKALLDFETTVLTYPPESVKKLYRQLIRWSRANYYFFYRELRDGTMFKRGPLYVFNFLYTTILPFLVMGVSIFDMIFLGSTIVDTNPSDYEVALLHGGNFLLHLPIILAKRIVFSLLLGTMTTHYPFSVTQSMFITPFHSAFHSTPTFLGLHFPRLGFKYSVILMHVASYLTAIPFIYALWRLLHEEKLKTLVIGSLALAIQLVVSIYALLTIWDQDKWLTR